MHTYVARPDLAGLLDARSAGDERSRVLSRVTRAQKDHISIRMLQNSISGIRLLLGFFNQNVGLCDPLDNCTNEPVAIRRALLKEPISG